MKRAMVLVLAAGVLAMPAWAAARSDVESCLADAVSGREPARNTMMTFTLKDDRTVADLKIDVASGDAELDEKVMQCLARLEPEASAKPGPYAALVSWRFRQRNTAQFERLVIAPQGPGSAAFPRSVGKPHLCIEYYPPQAVHERTQGTTKVRFYITTDGSVRDVEVTQSSGSELLDQATLVCVRSWQYRPAERDGTPIEVPWKADVRWALH